MEMEEWILRFALNDREKTAEIVFERVLVLLLKTNAQKVISDRKLMKN